MTTIIYTLLSVLAISAISMIGVFTLAFKKEKVNNIIFIFVGFAAGALFAAAFFDLIPKSYELFGETAYTLVLAGIVLFFIMETFLFWYHHHEQCTHDHHHKNCTVHTIKPVGYLNLIGDGMHNVIDGMIIAASYIISFKLGLVTTLAVALHEIPQEIGDFGILLHSGFEVKKALMFNFLSAVTAFLGVFFVYALGSHQFNINYLLPIAAGGFIYIAGSDLLPELHRAKGFWKSALQFAIFMLGIVIIYAGHVFIH